MDFNTQSLKTPYFAVDKSLLRKNISLLAQVAQEAGCKILLAQKAFSMYALYPLIGQFLSGTTASGLYEARLGREEMGGETHIFSPAYREEDFEEILQLCDHIVFNSLSQWQRFREKSLASGKSFGLRINPEHSTQDHAIYDPCSAGSRLGITASQLAGQDLTGIDGLHFHCLCQQNSDDLISTLAAVEEKFGDHLKKMRWVNFGGGHHITRADYNIAALVTAIKAFREKYDVAVYLEPGEAVALNAGFFVTSVMDIMENGLHIGILDGSAACHMPDVLEMPYRPPLFSSGNVGEKPYLYRLGGPTCLAGDIIGDYSFDTPLVVGDRLVFEDMAIYTMVKTNTFNGMPLPSIAVIEEDGSLTLVKEFSYSDFKNRLS